MTLPILYSFRRCPYAMRARMVLLHSKIQCEIREIKLSNKPKEMLAISPKGTVPVLILENGDILDESLDVMLWAIEQGNLRNLFNSGKKEILDLIKINDGEFKDAIDRYKYSSLYPEKPMIEYRKMGELFLEKIESYLEKNKFIFGKNISLADLAIFPFIRQFCRVDIDWFNSSLFKKIKEWTLFFEGSENFIDIMRKIKPWTTGDKPTLFLE
ncbi:MAG: glutathione S-transferase [Alphaproteobacteria bacterium]|jgi:glutathione S-transferase|nr:glutathione S-transferase [Alphaproteobacteria bacterium]|tara:strand:+ start:280 stop:918 length:639 start_codon:yes stop_codon:yes gene_type:complete